MNISTTIDILFAFTMKHMETKGVDRSLREIIVLRELFPSMFEKPDENDFFVGKTSSFPIVYDHYGFYVDTTILLSYKQQTIHRDEQKKLKEMVHYWTTQNAIVTESHVHFLNDSLIPDDSAYMFTYELLLQKGILGLVRYLESKKSIDEIDGTVQALYIVLASIQYYIDIVKNNTLDHRDTILKNLEQLLKHPPVTTEQTAQLLLLFGVIMGVRNMETIASAMNDYVFHDSTNPLSESQQNQIKEIIQTLQQKTTKRR